MAGMLYQTYMKFFPIPLPSPDTFKDQTAVVTGGTSGLGLAAAAHLINLGASEVIITSRDDPSRSSQRLDVVEEELDRTTGGRSRGKVRILQLDMCDYASVVEFAARVKEIKKGAGGVDVVLLNAGTIGVDPKITKHGWEENIQVNTLSTLLLASLLVPHMKSERARRTSPAHLSIVGSMQFADPDIKQWATNESRESQNDESILKSLSSPKQWPGGSNMYAMTKLLTMYGFQELVERALGADGRPEVIVNTMCPGIVNTGLSRHYKDKGVAFVVLIKIFTTLFSKSAENGARTYMAAVTTKEEQHGNFIQFYKSDKQVKAMEERVLTSDAGRQMQRRIWQEIVEELVAKVPETRSFLESSKQS